MTSHGNGLSGAIEFGESQAQGLQDSQTCASVHLQSILARRPKVTGRRGRPSSVATLDERQDRTKSVNNAGDARVYTSDTRPYIDLLCGLVQQAYEDATNDREYQRANTANIRRANFDTAVYFFRSKAYTEICDALGVDGERIKRKALV